MIPILVVRECLAQGTRDVKPQDDDMGVTDPLPRRPTAQDADPLTAAIERASAAVDAAEEAVTQISATHFEADLTLARSAELLRDLTAVQDERHDPPDEDRPDEDATSATKRGSRGG